MTILEDTAVNASLALEVIIKDSHYSVDVINTAFVAIHALNDLVRLLNESNVPKPTHH